MSDLLWRIVSDLAINDDGRGIQLDLFDSYQLQLELAYHEFIAMDYSELSRIARLSRESLPTRDYTQS